MASNKLRDIRDRMEQKWTSGQFIFGYEDDINENHNIDYPLLLVIPPNSTLPATDKDPINAHIREEFDFEVIFARPYRTSTTNTGANDTNTNLDVIYTLLESEAYNWLQAFLDSYPNKQVTLVPTPITVERETNQQNDKLVQIRMNFTVDTFSHAFASFDDQFIRDLSPLAWLRSDVGVKTTYFGGKEVVSKWIDQSGNGNDFAQTTSAKQPEYVYEMVDASYPNDRYPFIKLDGSDDFLECTQAAMGGSGLDGRNTIFFVAKMNDVNSTAGKLFGYNAGNNSGYEIGIRSTTKSFSSRIVDASGDALIDNESESSSSVKLKVRALELETATSKHWVNGSIDATDTTTGYSEVSAFGGVSTKALIGTDSTSSSDFLNASIQEIIVFNTDLSDSAITKVSDYLNQKYRLY
tara:strand:- start:14888 stop:16114 length:1227 start_codon:yes stop_codon:yes gene_type:complete